MKHGGDVHAKDKGGLVPLHNACSYGHYEVANLLIKVGSLGHQIATLARLVAAAGIFSSQGYAHTGRRWLVHNNHPLRP